MTTAAERAVISGLRQKQQLIVVTWADGHESVYHSLWLRDNCPEPTSRHPNGQRLLEAAAIPPDIHPAAVEVERERLAVTWAGDGHRSRYDPAWLRAHCACEEDQDVRAHHPILWSTELGTAIPEASYPRVAARPQTLARWLGHVRDYGFALLHDVPGQPGMVTKIVELFGFVRETNYGRLFDVRAVADPTNLAYTALALSGHTDNPYRDPVPTLQLLHCLASTASGGDSLLVDGFQVAAYLRREFPDQFERLAATPVTFRYADAHSELAATSPIIRLRADGEVAGIRYNNRAMQPVDLPAADIPAFYHALRTFAGLLDSASFQIRFKLEPGDLICFDNERILHGRTGFDGAGARHLQGCYADRDGLLSTLAVLNR